MKFHRRELLMGMSSIAVTGRVSFAQAQSQEPILSISSRTLEVKKRAAKVYGLINARGGVDIASLWSILDLTPEGRGTDWYPKLEYPL